jgi:hypothetical protein
VTGLDWALVLVSGGPSIIAVEAFSRQEMWIGLAQCAGLLVMALCHGHATPCRAGRYLQRKLDVWVPKGK